ncbi:DEAD/DEAH box helicase domain-containing protein [Phthorimaea operculella]|nr:DEAD/DEAH box helicase domain-containing protein [Phthorimaea operculella]
MDDLQLNISIPKKVKKKVAPTQQNASAYKFVSQTNFTGKTIARKRPQSSSQKNLAFNKSDGEPQNKVAKQAVSPPSKQGNKQGDFASNLRDLSENKGKYHGKNYQDLSDDLQVKQRPRSGGWISSLFKNNPDVPKVGQRAVKPIVEKVFAAETFADLDIHPHSVANLQQNLKLKTLMTVQKNAIPVILQGRDVLIRSQTGSGKTLAYALPIVEGLQAIRPKINRHDGIRVVVVVPTRELAVQTYELFIKLVKPFTWIVPGILSGGQKRKAEKAVLRKGLSILVGTPGRINDHLRHTQTMKFNKTNCLVLDEADRLLDMGYEKDVAAIVKAIVDHKKAATYDPMALMKQSVKKTFSDNDQTPDEAQPDKTADEKTEIKHHLTEIFLSTERQTILLSATLTKAVENLAGLTLVDPVFVDTSEGRALIADSLKPQKDPKPMVETNPVKEEIPNKKDAKNKTNAVVKAENSNDQEEQVETKRGLKAFSGIKHRELFENSDGTVNDIKQKASDANTTEDSDSDSDYEYFKVQKELEEKKPKVESIDEEEELKPSATGTTNTFAQAVKSAIVEDELVLPSSVNQSFLVIPMKLRLVTLCSLIVEHCVLNKKGGKMIVFMATLEMVDYHADLIESVLTGKDVKIKKKEGKETKAKKKKAPDGSDDEESSSSDSDMAVDYEAPAEGGIVPVAIEMFKLHGSMPHEQRMEVFKQFRLAPSGVLICTTDMVVDYEAPAEGGIVPVAIEMFKLHGSMPHEQRMEVFKQFRLAPSGVLICTTDMAVDYEAPAEGGIVPVAIEMFKLHGSMPHEQRMEVFKQFRLAPSGVLICTVSITYELSSDSDMASSSNSDVASSTDFEMASSSDSDMAVDFEL